VWFYSDAAAKPCYDPGFGKTIQWDTPVLSGYKYKFSRHGIGQPPPRPFCEVPRVDVLWALSDVPFDVLWLHGYCFLTHWIAGTAAWLRGKRILLRTEDNLLDSRPTWKRAAKEMLLPMIFQRIWGLWIGRHNREYLVRYGVREERLVFAPYAVENQFFQQQREKLFPHRGDLRKEFGVCDDSPVILFCGKLVPKKDPLVLLEAFRRLAKKSWLLLVGDGPLRDTVLDFIREHGLKRVFFCGFLNQSEIGKAYVSADVLVLPSRWGETWGLVVNEAMNFGLPVVVTDKVGCASDLVVPGENGLIVPAGDSEALAQALEVLVEDPDTRSRFGQTSLSIIENYSLEKCADGVVAASLAAAAEYS
jgi:glycosyltransferase involved in cell wall biosynthesis